MKKIIFIFLMCVTLLGVGCSEKYPDDYFSSYTGIEIDTSNSGESTEIQDSSSSDIGDGIDQDATSSDNNDEEEDKDDSSTETPPQKENGGWTGFY